MSGQDCGCSKRVLQTADLRAMIQVQCNLRGVETLALTSGGPKLCSVVTIIVIIALLYHLLVQLFSIIIAEKEFANQPGIH